MPGQRYYWVTGYSEKSTLTEQWTSSSFWGINYANGQSRSYYNYVDPQPVNLEPEANFVEADAGGTTNTGYAYLFRSAGTPVVYTRDWVTTSGWWIFSTKTYHLERITSVGRTNYDYHSVKADYPVKIEFMGHETGSVDITSKNDINLTGVISNLSGPTTIVSENGAINQLEELALIRAENITLKADNGSIGTQEKATIRRNSGKWTEEGYDAGDIIRFAAGFGENNNRDFVIYSVTEDTITLATGSGLVTMTDNDGFTIYNVTDDTTIEYNIDPPVIKAVGDYYKSVRTDLSGGLLSANGAGLVAIEEIEGKVTVGGITSANDDVGLGSEGGIFASDNSSLISGDNIYLTSVTGAIGTSALNLCINTNNDNNYDDDAKFDSIFARAFNDIYLREISGDLRAVTIESLDGDVNISIDDGNLIDVNTIERRDVRTEAELADLWDEMNLIDNDGSETQDAYKLLKTREYNTYWGYRTGKSFYIDSISQISGTAITFDADHGLKTGDALLYRVMEGDTINRS